MIKSIHINQYRKLKNMDIDFKGINVISGTNGTCKSSLLHIVSNSFQAVTKSKRCDFVNNYSCIDTIRAINNIMNPKIENLTKGDREYNDPAPGVKGILYTVNYNNSLSINFRRHNSTKSDLDKRSRYSIKPLYKSTTKDSLPFCPVIYLGLSRLMPLGEFQNDNDVSYLKKSLPQEYLDEIKKEYDHLIRIKIESIATQNMGNIKYRSDFNTNKKGVDANTISAGEDNLFIILSALVSLKYYYDSITSKNETESILLIDEADATLHPSLQNKLLTLFESYSKKYRIQIIFTTHSLSMLEHASKKEYNIIYFYDNMSSVYQMKDPNYYKIKMYLQNTTKSELYIDESIPVFTEDKEARIFLKKLIDYLESNFSDFKGVGRLFHFVKLNLGAQNLIDLFADINKSKPTIMSICILDGDQKLDVDKFIHDYNIPGEVSISVLKSCFKSILKLPGDDSPERLIVDYLKRLYDDDDDSFWLDDNILENNLGKEYYHENILSKVETMNNELNQNNNDGLPSHGKSREFYKSLFKDNADLFGFAISHWLNNPENSEEISKFYDKLFVAFQIIAEYHGVDRSIWTKPVT